MRKIAIKSISLVLILSSLFMLLVSCVPFWQEKDANQGSEDESPKTGGPIELQDKNSELLIALTNNLKSVFTSYDMLPAELEYKIDCIKNGQQALHVEFDPSSYYYVCAYYNLDHYEETFLYCCVDEYTWVKYENEKDILEEYKNLGLVVAFQLNKSTFVKDIMSENTSVPYMEHFQQYKPEFVDGVNAKTSIFYDETFIYLNSSDKKEIYFPPFSNARYYSTINCLHYENHYFISEHHYMVDKDGEIYETDLESKFGKYYDGLVSIMVTDKYSYGDEYVTYFNLLISVSDFADFIRSIAG